MSAIEGGGINPSQRIELGGASSTESVGESKVSLPEKGEVKNKLSNMDGLEVRGKVEEGIQAGNVSDGTDQDGMLLSFLGVSSAPSSIAEKGGKLIAGDAFQAPNIQSVMGATVLELAQRMAAIAENMRK